MNDETDISLQRVSTAEVVAETLVRLIVTGVLKAGEPLRESSLSQRLGISRNSLREGIRLLEQSRLVEYEIHRGAVVVTPTVKEFEDLYRVRLHIETLAAKQVPTEAQLKGLEDAFQLLVESAATGEAEKIIHADLSWHQSVVDMLGSERISTFYTQIRKELVFYFTVISYADEEFLNPHDSVVSRHKEILDVIISGDSERAAEMLRAHIVQNFERLREILNTQQNSNKE